MKGTAKSKVVTSGRLSGRVKVPAARRRAPPILGPPPHPEPAYSLYSTDAEDQVTSLHKGLDRCAALLGGILQADTAEASPNPARAVTSETGSKPATSQGKKPVKKSSTPKNQRNCRSVQRVPSSTTPRTARQPALQAAHSGVKLHPPQRRPRTPLLSPSQPQRQQQQQLGSSTPPPAPQTRPATPPTQPSHHTGRHAPPARPETGRDETEEDFVPVRDTDALHGPEHGRLDEVPEGRYGEEDCCAGREVQFKSVQGLLGELRGLIAGQGSVAERLLSHLEQAVTSPPVMKSCCLNARNEPHLSLHSQNALLHRRVNILQQQLKDKDKAGKPGKEDTLCSSKASALQGELAAAQCRLQELQGDVTKLQKALHDTQSRLRDSEAHNAHIKTDLEVTRSRLLQSEKERSLLASLAEQRLEEIRELSSALQRHSPADEHSVLDQGSAGFSTQQIAHYLMSLKPTRSERVPMAAEREEAPEQCDPTSAARLQPHPSHQVQSCGQWLAKERGQLSTVSRCDVDSVCSGWSESTFNTRDEAAFRDGLSALDASIASLQKTIQLDLRK
ncbi:uncharacterized protein V6R79_012692 [Siganus canaliculatus]